RALVISERRFQIGLALAKAWHQLLIGGVETKRPDQITTIGRFEVEARAFINARSLAQRLLGPRGIASTLRDAGAQLPEIPGPLGCLPRRQLPGGLLGLADRRLGGIEQPQLPAPRSRIQEPAQGAVGQQLTLPDRIGDAILRLVFRDPASEQRF